MSVIFELLIYKLKDSAEVVCSFMNLEDHLLVLRLSNKILLSDLISQNVTSLKF